MAEIFVESTIAFCHILYPAFIPLYSLQETEFGAVPWLCRRWLHFNLFRSISLWALCNQDIKVKWSVSLLWKAQDHSNCLAGERDCAWGWSTKMSCYEKGYMYLSSVGSLKIKKSDNAPWGSSCACAFQADELNTCHSSDFRHIAFLEMRLYF